MGDTLELVKQVDGVTGLLKISPTRDGAAEKCPDVRRVAPIRDSVWR